MERRHASTGVSLRAERIKLCVRVCVRARVCARADVSAYEHSEGRANKENSQRILSILLFDQTSVTYIGLKKKKKGDNPA